MLKVNLDNLEANASSSARQDAEASCSRLASTWSERQVRIGVRLIGLSSLSQLNDVDPLRLRLAVTGHCGAPSADSEPSRSEHPCA
jgi:hypothetical protein